MKVIGAIVIVLALVTGILPMFTDCQSQGKAIALADGRTIPMKCHWTGRAELVAAVPLLGLGVVTVASRRRETQAYLSVMGLILGVMVALLPTRLIGVCANPDMLCNSVMKPALVLAGAVVAMGSVGMFVLSRRGAV